MTGDAQQDAEQDAAPNILPGDGSFRVRPNASIGGESPRHPSGHGMPDGKVYRHLHLDDYVLTV